MSDTPVRHGPPAPPQIDNTPAVDLGVTDRQVDPATAPVAQALSPPAPVTIRESKHPGAIAYRSAPATPASYGRTRLHASAAASIDSEADASASLAATPSPLPRLPGPVRARDHQSRTMTLLNIDRLAAIALAIVLVAGAIWLDRDRHALVAGFGIIPQPGAMEIALLHSGLTAGDPAPNFRLRTTGGDVIELSDLRGQPVLIHFWTTWCLVCIGELPTLHDLADAHAGNLQVVGIAVGEETGRVEQAATAHGAGYPMLLDRDMEVSQYYGVRDYPATVAIDASGMIASIDFGAVSPGDLDTRLDDVLGN